MSQTKFNLVRLLVPKSTISICVGTTNAKRPYRWGLYKMLNVRFPVPAGTKIDIGCEQNGKVSIYFIIGGQTLNDIVDYTEESFKLIEQEFKTPRKSNERYVINIPVRFIDELKELFRNGCTLCYER